MMNLKKAAAALMSIVMLPALFTGCGNKENSSDESAGESQSSQSSESSQAADAGFDGNFENFTPPKEGEDIIVMTIKDYGDIKIKLFPEYAEKGVENFKGLAEKGYYDGLIFHRVIDKFMIQGGDPLGNGTGGESIWGEKFDGGVSMKLTHAAGAVAYANSGSTSTNGSQFYIVTGDKYDENTLSQYFGSYLTDNIKDIYTNQGGYPFLDGGYTVFGQVFDGLDIVFEIQKVATDSNDKPEKDVVIEKVSVEKYDGGDVKFYMSDYK